MFIWLLLIALITSVVILMGLSYFLACYTTHISMTEGNHVKVTDEKLHYISFKKFKKLYKTQAWDTRDNYFKLSHFGYNEEGLHSQSGGYIHADIIVINFKRYAFWPHSYIAFKIWEKKNKFKG